MTIISKNQLQGNWAEQYVASQLANQDCLIRFVTQGHDVGIDLYCETTWQGIPHLHFWCQVKSKKNLKGISKTTSHTFDKNHIQYWLKQPVPVFIFIVPASSNAPNKFIPFYILTPLYRKGNKLTSFKKITSPNDLIRFLYIDLSFLTQEWDLKEGKISPIKHPRDSDFVEFAPGITLPYKKEIYRGLRWTLWRLISDIIFLGDEATKSAMLGKFLPLTDEEEQRVKQSKPYIEALRILLESNNDKHYEGYYIIGNYLELLTKHDESLQYYGKAMDIIEKDMQKRKNIPPFYQSLHTTIRRATNRVIAKKEVK